MTDLPFACSCGKVHGHVGGASPKTGTHAVCFCASCRAGEIYAGLPDPAPDPVAVFQTTPDRLNIKGGQEHLAAFSFGPKNLLRWQATCCGTTLFNTMRNPRLSFVGIRTHVFADTAAIGPVIAKGFIPKPNGKARHEGLAALAGLAALRMFKQRVTGKWRDNPLFDTAALTPIGPVTVVSPADRRALLNR